jgi:hypothetical protein
MGGSRDEPDPAWCPHSGGARNDQRRTGHGPYYAGGGIRIHIIRYPVPDFSNSVEVAMIQR